jgi:hypothetical protein
MTAGLIADSFTDVEETLGQLWRDYYWHNIILELRVKSNSFLQNRLVR